MTTTRTAGLWAAALLLIAQAVTPVAAQPRHSITTFGDAKYMPDFKHFDYVNPNAPKGGRLTTVGPPGFDSFNPFVLKGSASIGLGLMFDSLMEGSADEPDSYYGLIAASAEIAKDGKSVVFKLRPEARFSNGTPINSADVVWTLATLKEKGHPRYNIVYRDIAKVEAIDKLTVRFSFQGELTRDLPQLAAGLTVLSKDAGFPENSLVPMIGSGPYLIDSFEKDRYIQYKRRPDYWAKDLPVNRGRYNFDELRFESFRDRNAELEALKTGTMDLREEFTAKDWVTAYEVDAVKSGKIQRLTLPDERPSGTQGFFINTRRAKFADVRVRRALDMAFDYEWTNKNLFYSLYTRTQSYFENSDMKAKGSPSPEELALLEPFRAKLPAAVFGPVYEPPKTDGSGNDRRNLREAQKLLQEAGWKLDPTTKSGARVKNDKGETLDVEFLITSPTMERIIGPYIRQLEAIGINATIRRVDPAQYEARAKSYDFDIVVSRFVMNLTPGNELLTYMSSDSATAQGSQNLAGIKDPVVDAILEKIIGARSRPELLTAARALDRVLRAGNYWVPHWYKGSHHIAHWDKFSRPEVKARYGLGVLDTWWYDATKAAKLTTN
ncbi:MAG: extracellular solute-binding protein [Hyphomicrobiaceae bacterium]